MKYHRQTGSLPQDPTKCTEGQTCSSNPPKKPASLTYTNAGFQVQPRPVSTDTPDLWELNTHEQVPPAQLIPWSASATKRPSIKCDMSETTLTTWREMITHTWEELDTTIINTCMSIISVLGGRGKRLGAQSLSYIVKFEASLGSMKPCLKTNLYDTWTSERSPTCLSDQNLPAPHGQFWELPRNRRVTETTGFWGNPYLSMPSDV